jgi:hypothetical protein
VPSAAARASRQSSAPVGTPIARGDTDRDRTVAGHPAANRQAAGAVDDTVAYLDAEAGAGITGAALRDDLHGPAAIERRTSLRRIGREGARNCYGQQRPNGGRRHHFHGSDPRRYVSQINDMPFDIAKIRSESDGVTLSIFTIA